MLEFVCNETSTAVEEPSPTPTPVAAVRVAIVTSYTPCNNPLFGDCGTRALLVQLLSYRVLG